MLGVRFVGFKFSYEWIEKKVDSRKGRRLGASYVVRILCRVGDVKWQP